MPVKNMLELSTMHLRKQDVAALEDLFADQPEATPHVYRTDDGYYVTTGVMFGGTLEDGANRLSDLGFTPEFAALMAHAAQNECGIMSFDNDAEPEPGFPLFDQETDELLDASEAGFEM